MTNNPARGRLFFDLSIDLSTARLVKAMQALVDSRLEDSDVARALVGRARAVRSFVEAGENALAQLTLEQMLEVELKEPGKQMLARRATQVSRALSI